jgi:hypothetical protein
MVPQRHEDVAGVAGDHDVFDLWEEGQPIEGQMALDEAAMFLRVQMRDELVEVVATHVQPRRHLPQARDGCGAQDEVGEDGLHPGRPRLI